MHSIDYNTLIERLGQLDPIVFESLRSFVLQSDESYNQFLEEHQKRFIERLTDSQIITIFTKESEHIKQYHASIDGMTKILTDNQILTGTDDEIRNEIGSHVYGKLLMHFKGKDTYF